MDGLLEYIGLAQQKSEKEVAKGQRGSIREKAKSLKGMLLFLWCLGAPIRFFRCRPVKALYLVLVN
jgi:hypothetical protein